MCITDFFTYLPVKLNVKWTIYEQTRMFSSGYEQKSDSVSLNTNEKTTYHTSTSHTLNQKSQLFTSIYAPV
jgi:hypothetical protein